VTKAAKRKSPARIREEANVQELERPAAKLKVEPLSALNESQKRYIAAIKSATLTFGIGPAGTGKTYIAGALAAQAFESKSVDTIIITRPAVDAGESLGFLPGELEEKYAVYIDPFRSVLEERLGKGAVGYMLRHKSILPQPLAYMRGKTFKNAFVILDEAQNVSPDQMKMFLTRIGHNCKVVVDGDLSQKDIRGPSGLDDARKRLAWIPSVRVVEFGLDDIVRSGIVADIIKSYERPES
jgi:phosphate starvation-inducible protein PhoH and related proteins